jgi:hypothetical protein
MALTDLQGITGVAGIRTVSGCTNIIEYKDGGARPATELEVMLWRLLTGGSFPR